MAERKKVIVVTGASQGIGGGSGQRISQRGLPCCRHVTINKTCAVAPWVIKTPMLPVKRDMTCWQIASGRQDRGTYQISWERSCILKQLRSRQARSRTSPPFETRAFPDKIDHILSWLGMQRTLIGRSWSETRRWPRINYRRCTPLA